MFNIDGLIYEGPRNFVRTRTDNQAYTVYKWKQNREDPFPYRLITGEWILRLDPKEKKRHYWIFGPASYGKTRWAQTTFDNKRVFFAGRDARYPFDAYEGEDIIVYDDITPKLDELLYSSNIYNGAQ